MIDCLHIYRLPPSQTIGKVIVTSKGVPNSCRNGLEYIKDIGICLEHDYVFKGSPVVCKEPVLEKLSKGHIIERKIFIHNYVQIGVSSDVNLSPIERHKQVTQQIEIQPVVARFLANFDFLILDHTQTPIYMGASASEKMIYYERTRKGRIAREEAERKIFFEKCAREEELVNDRSVGITTKKSVMDKRREEVIEKENVETRVGYHAVLIVGYGELDGIAYFICQNSYGENWGHRGYFRIAMDAMSHFYYVVGSHIRRINKKTIDRTQEMVDRLMAAREEERRKLEDDWRAEYERFNKMSKERSKEKETK